MEGKNLLYIRTAKNGATVRVFGDYLPRTDAERLSREADVNRQLDKILRRIVKEGKTAELEATLRSMGR